MGQFAAAIPYIIAAVGAGASYVNTRNTARRQDRELANNIRAQRDRQREADKKVNELVNETGASNPDAFKKSALDQYRSVLAAGADQTNTGLANVTGASNAYNADVAKAKTDVAGYGDETASLLSRIDAPQKQRRHEAELAGNFGSDIDRIRRFSAGDNFLSQMRMQGIRRNPLLDAFASFASSYGGGGGSFGAGGGGNGTAASTWVGGGTGGGP